MADSNITKLALSNALKELLAERPFGKISVSDICQKCSMNRKSFYYHFRDKYDLVNWIFDTEFMELVRAHELNITVRSFDFDERWENIEVFCRYFYDNRIFYRSVLKVEGQNSFSSHFREFLQPLLRLRVEDMLEEEIPQIVYDFVADGIVCAIERWLLEKNCISPEEMLKSLKKLIQILFKSLDRRANSDPKWLE